MLDWRSLNAALTFCYSDTVAAANLHGEHVSHEMVAWFIQRGFVSTESPRGPLKVRPGQWLIPSPVAGFRRDFSRDASIISIHFQACWADGRNVFEEGLPVVIAAEDYPKLRKQALQLLRFVRKHFGPLKTRLLFAGATLSEYMQLQSLFARWFSTFIEVLSAEGLKHTRFGNIDERVRRGLFLIDHLPLDQKFPKASLARQLELSYSQLDRLFVRETGGTPQGYFEQRRLHQARLALSEKAAFVKEVAYGLGFQSASHFSTWFRRAAGKSPRDFIQDI